MRFYVAPMRKGKGRHGKRLLPACFFAVTLLCVSSAQSQTAPPFTAMRVASGLNQPLFVTAPPGDTTRLFIVQKTGQVRILNLRNGKIKAKPFLNIQSRLAASGEQGLLGMAFDPRFSSNGKFYLNFTVPGGAFGNGVTHVSQFQVSPRKPNVANTSNERILLTFDHPQPNHNGGWIGFSPRQDDANNLYIATGDGGGGNDQGTGHIEPGGNAQSNITLLGKILRVQVNSNLGTASIPSNNPFFGSGTFRQEIWTWGLRNPFRASFDRQTGRFFLGDVGQGAREEIDVQQPTNPSGGENYGWRLREGTIATPASIGGPPPPGNVDPILDYGRSTGGTVIGGYVYRSSRIPALQGKYVFGDFVASKIFTLDYNGTTASNFQDITSQLFPTRQGGFVLDNPSSFGEDASGELYITDISNGSVFKIVP